MTAAVDEAKFCFKTIDQKSGEFAVAWFAAHIPCHGGAGSSSK